MGGDAEEMSLVVRTEGGCCSFSHKLNDPSPASDMAMCTGRDGPIPEPGFVEETLSESRPPLLSVSESW